MKILIINTWYYPNLMGGAEHSVKLLAENLYAQGNEVTVLTADGTEPGIKSEIVNGVKILRCFPKPYDLYKAYFKKEQLCVFKVVNKYFELFNPRICKTINNILDEVNPDVAHINCFSGLSYNIFEILHKKNIPIVYTARNYFVISPSDRLESNNIISKGIKKIYWMKTKKYLNYIDVLASPSQFTIKKIQSMGILQNVKKIICIPNSINVNIENTKRIIEDKRKNSDKITKYLYVGWLSESKGIKKLVEAFNFIFSENQNVELWICGDGDMRKYVEEQVKKNSRIKYRGKLKPEELEKQYIKADVLVVPSIWDEPFGRVVIEGNSYGLPVICSNKGGIPEIINEMCGGIVFNTDIPHDLIMKMKLMLDKKRYDVYYLNILKNIKKYDIAIQIQNYYKVYESILK